MNAVACGCLKLVYLLKLWFMLWWTAIVCMHYIESLCCIENTSLKSSPSKMTMNWITMFNNMCVSFSLNLIFESLWMQVTDGHWEAVVIFTKHTCVCVHLCVFRFKEGGSDVIISRPSHIFQLHILKLKKCLSEGKANHRPCICDRSLTFFHASFPRIQRKPSAPASFWPDVWSFSGSMKWDFNWWDEICYKTLCCFASYVWEIYGMGSIAPLEWCHACYTSEREWHVQRCSDCVLS